MRFWVPGIPQPKGSTRSFLRGNKVITTSVSTGLKAWEYSIKTAIINQGLQIVHGPINITLEFLFPRPKSRKSERKYPYPDVRPDLDKTVRGSLDSLNKILIDDDSRIIKLSASKAYTNEQPGVWITIEEAKIDW